MANFIFNSNYQIQIFKNLIFKNANMTKQCRSLMQCLDLLTFDKEIVKEKYQSNAVMWYISPNYQYVFGFLEYNKGTELVPIILDKNFYVEWLKPYHYVLSLKKGCGSYYKIKIKHETFKPNQISELSHMVCCYYKIPNYLNLYQPTEEMYVCDHSLHFTSLNVGKYLRIITQTENLNNRKANIKFLDDTTFSMKNTIFGEDRRLKTELMQNYPNETITIFNAITNGNLYLMNDTIICPFSKNTSRPQMLQLASVINKMNSYGFNENTNYNPYGDISKTWLYFALYLLNIINSYELAKLQQEYFYYNDKDTFILYDMPHTFASASSEYDGSKTGLKIRTILHYQGREIIVN